MHEFWFISVPISGNLTNTHLNLKNKLHDAADVSLFSIPVFKIGTLDALVVMSDDLAKFDLAFEQSTLKISDILRTLLRNAQTDLNSQLTVNEIHQNLRMEYDEISHRQVAPRDHRTSQSAKSLPPSPPSQTTEPFTVVISFARLIAVAGSHVHRHTHEAQDVKLHTSEREPAELAKKGDRQPGGQEFGWNREEGAFCSGFGIPRNHPGGRPETGSTSMRLLRRWSSRDPRSTKVVEDDEYGVFTVTLFKRIVEDFSHRCREEKFVVRDFKYDEAALTNQKKDLEEITATEKEQQVRL
ncbi:V-ATPase subunit C-domain-containing protein [Jimgerdemannia flammicorona]|uniref:V-type proton ATPase subunit C n=1 Tax=Jimgerdemannia flammicorona TaxID=994334 RepID=A0A433QZU8_9FUNG|nr:V-ATPase subunit C-domain-containing protein [Jimgerdemannia flammicorona]